MDFGIGDDSCAEVSGAKMTRVLHETVESGRPLEFGLPIKSVVFLTSRRAWLFWAILLLMPACETVLPFALRALGGLAATATANHSQELAQQIREFTSAVVADQALDKPQKTAPSTLSLEVALLRQIDVDGVVRAQAIADGEVLEYRGENESDRFKIFFRPAETCHVWVVLIDGTGFVQPLFPSALTVQANPVQAGVGISLPAGERAFEVDQYLGVETIYFVASRKPRPDLDRMLAKFASMKRAVLKRPAAVEEPFILRSRGLVATRGDKASIEIGEQSAQVDTTRFRAQFEGSDLVLTRWFTHR